MIRFFNISFWKKKAISLKGFVISRIAFKKDSLRKSRIRKQVQIQKEHGVFAVEIKNHLGIGARLIWCLEILLFCKENNLKPFFKFSYKDSKESEDFFGSYFVNDNKALSQKTEWITIRTIGDLGFKKNYNNELTIESANKLIKENLIIRNEIIQETEEFFEGILNGEMTLGIHYRNTDKKSEALPVDHETVLLNIEHCLQKHSYLKKIFVTTDDSRFVEFIKSSHLSSIVFFRQDSFRSNDGMSIHERKDLNRYDMNRDAIVNMMILTKCSFILKTASILSSCALLFNPKIPFVMLNQPFDNKLWFPERELIKQMEYTPLKKRF